MTQCSSSSGSSSSTSTSSNGRDFKDQSMRPIEEKLMVAVRIKPLSRAESGRSLHAINEKMVMIEDVDVEKQKRSFPRQYLFDVVFGEDSTQEAVYEGTTRSLVQNVLLGYNATVFAYGATGAGKTHTMVGSPSNRGIMVRALNDIFLATRRLPENVEHSVTMSYMEIYNENIRDLLNPSSGYLELRDESRGRYSQVAGLTEVSTTSTDEVMQLLHKGNRARTVEPTAANETSSRSHALLSVIVKQSAKPVDRDSRHRVRITQGRLFMIDLAGSERAKQTKNQGKRLQEGAHINRSLLALGNCINALSGGARYVNYRDSKLTRLLKDALSGNCRTVMIAHVSPATIHRDESRNTLIYADRANRISNKVERNVLDVSYHVSQYRDIISDLKNEISRLRTKMTDDRPRFDELKTNNQRGTDFKTLREKIVSVFKEQMRLRRKLMEMDSHLLSLNIAAEQQHQVISHWESRNNKLYKANRESTSSRPGTVSQIEEVDDADFIEDGKEDDMAVEQAWAELSEISRERERYSEMRMATERELESCRKRGATLEDELPSRINSDEERELLALMLRVHELEADKMMLQSERLVKQHELRRRELMLLRYDRQRQISDEIITRQRRIMEDGQLSLPPDLQNLYAMYQQEIHSATYTDNMSDLSATLEYVGKLPPISNRFSFDNFNSDLRATSSSAESDWEQSPLPPIQEPPEIEKIMGPIVHPILSPSELFPPIPPSNKKSQ
ncbi:kinesin-like protein KIF19 isoform X2 [Leptopilina heterotoma]|nr:kinesin-like protein KIF19 isoform X2 [Leptopilina heterotoma]